MVDWVARCASCKFGRQPALLHIILIRESKKFNLGNRARNTRQKRLDKEFKGRNTRQTTAENIKLIFTYISVHISSLFIHSCKSVIYSTFRKWQVTHFQKWLLFFFQRGPGYWPLELVKWSSKSSIFLLTSDVKMTFALFVKQRALFGQWIIIQLLI